VSSGSRPHRKKGLYGEDGPKSRGIGRILEKIFEENDRDSIVGNFTPK
jgi:hypothetical protein